MARYYEETALIEFVKKYTPHIDGETTMKCVERAIREAPTADVVPRAELDAMRGAANSYKMHYENVKTEVALDLLSELKKDIHNKAVFTQCRDIPSYIPLREFDAIIANISNRLYEKKKGVKNESKDT